MKQLAWHDAKNAKLWTERGIGFEIDCADRREVPESTSSLFGASPSLSSTEALALFEKGSAMIGIGSTEVPSRCSNETIEFSYLKATSVSLPEHLN